MALRLLAAALAVLAGAAPAAEIADATGRTVAVPEPASRVYVAGPPAAVLVYVLRPEALLGWSHGLRDVDRPYLLAPQRDLAELPPVAAKDGTPDLAAIAAAAPDLVVDYGSVRPSVVAQAEAVQTASGIPTVLLDGAIDAIPETLRSLGAVVGVSDRAEELATYAEATLAYVDATLARVAAADRPRVYLARGPDGLQSGGPGSINAEIIARAGAVNVVDTGAGRNLVDVTPADLAAWAPEVVLTLNPDFAAGVAMPDWQAVPAVADGRVLLAPSSPFGFLNSPPSVNRLIGLRWLMHALYPDAAEGDIRAEVQAFYRLFYQADLDVADVGRLLGE